jgi:hypothetical protein
MATSNRIDDIAEKLHIACGVIADPTRASNEHRAEINKLSGEMNNIGGSRLGVAASIAATAHAEAWTDAEIVQAIGKASKRPSNYDSATNKTLGVFISEMKQFASPKVRADFPVILDACQSAWLAEQDYLAGLEGDEKKDADTPIRKFKPRIYHLVIEAARRIKDGKLVITSAADVVAWARDNDPSFNETKVAKMIVSSTAKLREAFSNFGLADVDEVQTVLEYLGTLTAKELLAARSKMLADAGEDEDDSVNEEQSAQPSVAADTSPSGDMGSTLIEGVYDYESAALAKLDSLAA